MTGAAAPPSGGTSTGKQAGHGANRCQICRRPKLIHKATGVELCPRCEHWPAIKQDKHRDTAHYRELLSRAAKERDK